MAYTTEEQDFWKFISKVKNWLPYILLIISLTFILRFGYIKYQEYRNDKQLATYQNLNKILSANDINTKVSLFKQYAENNKDYELTTLSAMNIAKELVDEGSYDKALEVLNSVSKVADVFKDAFYLSKSKIYYQENKYIEAINNINKIESKEWYISSRILKSDILVSDNKKEEAKTELNNLVDYVNKNLNGNKDLLILIQLRLNLLN